MAITYEWQQFGDGYVRRKAGSEDEWKDVAIDDVPSSVLEAKVAHQGRLERIQTLGYDPEDPPKPFVQIIRKSDPDA